MTCAARPVTRAPAVNRPRRARRRGDTAAARVPMAACGGGRLASRRGRTWAWVLAAGVTVAVAVRVPGVASDMRAAFGYLGRLHLSWLGVAVTAQIVSLASAVVAQRQLLAAGGARLPWRTVSALVLASTGLAKMMPAGPVTGGAWQAREYRRRGACTVAGVWAVLAGGFTSTVAVVAMLLAGTAVAGAGALPVLAGAAAVLAAGAAGLAAAPRRARELSGWLGRRHHHWPSTGRLAAALARLSRHHAGPGWAAGVVACTAVGLLGALTLTGTPPSAAVAAVIVYRVTGYWAVGATGTAVAAALARRPRGPGREAPTLSGLP